MIMCCVCPILQILTPEYDQHDVWESDQYQVEESSVWSPDYDIVHCDDVNIYHCPATHDIVTNYNNNITDVTPGLTLSHTFQS